MKLDIINYKEITMRNIGGDLRDVFWDIDLELQKNGINEPYLSNRAFIFCLEYILKNQLADLVFNDSIYDFQYLNNSQLEFKLGYLYSILPKEYDDSTPEKDINNLWWYLFCPIDISWKQPDGSYSIYG